MKKIQSQSTSNPASIAQMAAIAALRGERGFLREQNEVFKKRHDFVVRELALVKGVNVHPADGSFFVFPDMSGVIARRDDLDDDVALAEYLLDKAALAVVPGAAFGAPDCLRLSTANSMEILKEAMTRMRKLLA
jgi:aspartate aminotransferase